MGRRPLPHPEAIRLGKELRRRRALLGMTAAELAYRAGITANYLGDIETGRRRRNPSLVTMLSLARALGVELPDLLGSQAKTLGPASLEAARLLNALPEVTQIAVIRLLRAISPPL
jgi:transcriptional regulator with XRE-family HTH domain